MGMKGQTIAGKRDDRLLTEAVNRFRMARQTFPDKPLNLLEFPYAREVRLASSGKNNVEIRYFASAGRYEVKLFEFGPYNTRKVAIHIILLEDKPETNYEMTIS